MNNPLLQDFDLPPFSQIEPEHVEPAVDALLAENRAHIDQLLDELSAPTWETLVEPLERWDNRLDRAWSPVSHLNAVRNSDALRDAYGACLPKLSAYSTELGQNERLFQAYEALADGDGLNPDQRKVVDNALLDFRLSGVDLPADKKDRFREISQELSTLSSDYSDRLLDATHAWTRQIDDVDELAGLPQSALDLARHNAEQRDTDGWLLTLDYPSYMPVMTYCDNRELRHAMYEAYMTRASDQGPNAGEYDNSEAMERILALRHEAAQLLGFANYAERSLARKMARGTDEVMQFLNDLAGRGKPQAEKEFAELQAFAAEHHAASELQPWDVAYYSEKLRQQRYSITQEELKPYFRRALRAGRRGRHLASGRAFLRHSRRGRRGAGAVLFRPVCASEQAWRRLDGGLPVAHGQ